MHGNQYLKHLKKGRETTKNLERRSKMANNSMLQREKSTWRAKKLRFKKKKKEKKGLLKRKLIDTTCKSSITIAFKENTSS